MTKQDIINHAKEIVSLESRFAAVMPNTESIMVELARAYLAEHPDDEDEPITREFILSIGFDPPPFEDHPYYSTDISSEMVTIWFDGISDGVMFGIGNSHDSIDLSLPHIKTRGQLRQLIALLKGPQP